MSKGSVLSSRLSVLMHDHHINYEGYIYKFILKHGSTQVKKYWIVLINKDMYYFKDSSKSKFKHFYHLTGKFIGFDIGSCMHNGITYYSFSIDFGNELKKYYCKSKSEIEVWINMLKNSLHYRDIYQYYDFSILLGEGSYAQVYLASNKETKQKVAIKKYKKCDKSEDDLRRIKREIEIVKFCKHENIIAYIDDFEDFNYMFLILEYVDGGDLLSTLRNNPIIDDDEIKVILKQICTGVEYLHDHCIIHRDLKPNNILLKNDGGRLIIKICDFGLAKILGVDRKSVV